MPPAIKCAHDFAKGDFFDVTGVPSACFCGSTSPVSRDCGSRLCLSSAGSSRRRRGWEEVSKVMYSRWRVRIYWTMLKAREAEKTNKKPTQLKDFINVYQ